MAISESAKSWQQHRDPPNMWPILAGLSILLHVSILGLALPLVIRMRQSASTVETDVTVPVEWVEVTEQTAQSGPQVTSPEAAAPSDVSAPLSTETSADASDPAQPSGTALTASVPTESDTQSGNTATPRNTASQTAPEQSDLRPNPNPASSPAPTRQAASPRPTPQPTPQPAPQPTSQPTPQPTPQPTAQPSPQPTTPPQTPAPEPSQPPTLPTAGPPLTSPPEIASASRSAVFMSFVGFDQVPVTVPGDRPDTYPELQDSPSDSIVLSSGEHNCGDLGVLSHQRIAMRVDISANGTILSAWPQNSPGSDFERHVACLLPHADFRFRPAQVDSRNVRTDMVILEVEVGPT